MSKMLGVKEQQQVLSVYNCLKQHQPHLSEQERFGLVQIKVLQDYALTVTIEDLTKIVEVQENMKPKVPVKKKFIFVSHHEWCKNNKVPERVVGLHPTLHTRVINESSKKPCTKAVETVRKIRESCARTPKRTQRRYCTNCITQEPMCKKERYSKACLPGTPNSSIYEQLNYKKLTCIQKREFHLIRQREEFRKAQIAIRSGLPSCQCSGCRNQTTSDYDSDGGDITIDSNVLNNNGIDINMPGSSNILNSNTNTEANNEVDTGRVEANNEVDTGRAEANNEVVTATLQDLVDSVTGRFQESMTFCVTDDMDE